MARKLVVEIVGDSRSFEAALGRATRQTRTFGETLRRGALIAGAALGAGLAVAAKIGFDELSEGQKVAAQTSAALKSTGGVANVTAKEIEALAESQSKLTGIDDELIQTSENLLLTFKNVRNEVGKGSDIFNRATKSALDLSTAGFGSVESASKMLGKALNDPIKGMTALSRAGVTFSEDQKKAIKALVDSGKSLQAQKLILKEVESQVGGSAKAYGETLPGQLAKARIAFEEMAAGIVAVLLPALTKMAAVVSRVATFLTEHQTAAQVLAGALTALAAVLIAVGVSMKVFAALQVAWAAGTAVVTAAQWALNAALTANPIGVVVVALGALVAGLVLAYRHSETFRRIVDGAFKAVKIAAEAVLNFFRDNWKIIATLISGPFAPIVALATDAFGIRSKLIAAATAVLDFFKGNWKTIAVLISGPFAPLVALATDAFGIRSRLIAAFGEIVGGVREKVGALVDLVRGIPARLVRALGNVGDLLYNAGVQIIQGLIDGITAKLGDLWGLVGGIGGKIASLKGPIEKDRRLLEPQGRAIIEGLIAGMEARFPDLYRTAAGIAPALSGTVKDGFSGLGDLPDGIGQDILDTVAGIDKLTVAPSIEAMAQVGEAMVDATGEVVVFRDTIAALPPAASQAFKLLTDMINTALTPLPKVLEAPTAALMLVGDAIAWIGNAAYYTRAALKDTVAEILILWKQIARMNQDPRLQPGSPIPGLALGGPVKRNEPYIVGERGPELFVPATSGRIIPNGGGSGGLGVSAGTTVVVNVAGSVVTEREVGEFVYNYLLARQRRIGALGFN